jgi:hypothetical protein
MSASALEGATVDKWRRHVVSLANGSYSGNPFELEVEATFTQTSSGAQITLPGYYAGSDTWKIGFMPTKTGEWTWLTSSSDPDLDNKTGSLDCVASGNRGLLAADAVHPRKWKYADGPYVVPLAFRFDVFQEEGTLQRFTEIADFLATDVQGQMLEFTFRNEVYSDWQARQFDLGLWDRLEQRMEVLAARGLGIHFMFYADDAQQPNWSAKSSAEELLIRYTVARLAGFPVLVINTGIDIAEYRSQSEINWLGQQVRSLDPYGHPISSRNGGGSGNIVMSGETFRSRGDRLAKIADITDYFETSSVPVGMDDAWSENSPEAESRGKDFSEHDIRRAIWKCVVAGGAGALIRGSVLYNLDTWFRMADFEQDLESEQFLRLVNPFLDNKLGDLFGEMVPSPSLVSNGHALADPARAKILYFLMGKNDRYDSANGGSVTLKLGGLTAPYDAIWFDPRTGAQTGIGAFSGGTNHVVDPPTTDDWVLLLTATAIPTNTLMIDPVPSDGAVRSAPSGIDCGSDCVQDYEQGNEVELHPVPDYGSEFDGWGGDSDCLDGTVVMDDDTTCSADFAPCSNQSIWNVPPQTVTDSQEFEACNELSAGAGIFVIGSTGVVLFRAGNRIILKSGFEVESGGRFQARVGPQ